MKIPIKTLDNKNEKLLRTKKEKKPLKIIYILFNFFLWNIITFIFIKRILMELSYLLLYDNINVILNFHFFF